MQLALDLDSVPAATLVRLRKDRCFYADPDPGDGGPERAPAAASWLLRTAYQLALAGRTVPITAQRVAKSLIRGEIIWLQRVVPHLGGEAIKRGLLSGKGAGVLIAGKEPQRLLLTHVAVFRLLEWT